MMPGRWAVHGSRLQLAPGLRATFQRVPQSVGSHGEARLRSHGALPLGEAGAEVLLPVGAPEAFWIGLDAERDAAPVAVRIAVHSPGGPSLDVLTGKAWQARIDTSPRNYAICPPQCAIDGVPRGDRLLPFARCTDALERYQPCDTLMIAVHEPSFGPLGRERWHDDPALRVIVRLVSFEQFRDATGLHVAPLDPHDAYGGWRLP